MSPLVFLDAQKARHFDPEPPALRGVRLPDSPAVRAEISAMLEADPRLGLRGLERRRAQRRQPLRRLAHWVPRWMIWLRAMPLP